MSGGDQPWRRALLEQRARELAQPRVRDEVATVRVLVCALGGELYGLPLARVAHVTAYRRPAPMPGARAEVLGALAFNGVFHPLFDLGRLLGGGRPSSAEGYLVVLRAARSAAVRVDRAEEVADLVPLEPAESSAMPFVHDAISGYARPAAAGRLVALIDIDKLPLAPRAADA